MIELLSAENTALKTELDLYYKKVSKLQKVGIVFFLLFIFGYWDISVICKKSP